MCSSAVSLMQLRNVVPQWRVLNRGLATRGLATAKRDPTESQGARRARLAAAQAAVKEEARRRKMDELHAEIHWRVDAKLREIGVNPKKIWNLEYLTNPEAVTLMVCSEVLEKDLTQYEDGGEHYDPEMPVPEASAEDEVLDYIQKETGLYTEDPAITEGIRHIIRYRGLDKMSRQKIYDMTYGFGRQRRCLMLLHDANCLSDGQQMMSCSRPPSTTRNGSSGV